MKIQIVWNKKIKLIAITLALQLELQIKLIFCWNYLDISTLSAIRSLIVDY